MSEDLIRRSDAIKAIDDAFDSIPMEQTTEILKVRRVIRTLPSADRPQEWIPCSERLPEEDTNVLISYRYKEGEGDTSHVYIDITSYGDMYFGGRKVEAAKHWRQPFEYFTSNYEVIAWMPLPEPWKGVTRYDTGRADDPDRRHDDDWNPGRAEEGL